MVAFAPPAPTPYVDPFRPKVTQAGAPDTYAFRVVGWKADRLGRGS
jgi:hypothetical protein